MTKKYLNPLLYLGLSGFLVVVDQILKRVAQEGYQGKELGSKFISFTYHGNVGVAFGINVPTILPFLVFGGLILMIFFVWARSIKWNNVYTWICLCLILSGGFSNLIDRAVQGRVIDYIKIGFFPVFNLADAMITTGVFLMIIKLKKIVKL